jgi:tRNA A37 methylthiotransferase MiaB
MSVEVVTFGCRLNAAESEVIRREAERACGENRGDRLRGADRTADLCGDG